MSTFFAFFNIIFTLFLKSHRFFLLFFELFLILPKQNKTRPRLAASGVFYDNTKIYQSFLMCTSS